MRMTGPMVLLVIGMATVASLSAKSALALDAPCGGLPGPDKIPCACGDIGVTLDARALNPSGPGGARPSGSRRAA